MAKKKAQIIRLGHQLGYEKLKKSGINANKKGKANELKLAKYLTSWRGLPYQRVPMSGASAALKAIAVTGDIFCAVRDYRERYFSIETKFYSDLKITSKNVFKTVQINTFWDQAVIDAKTSQVKPLLALRDNKSKGSWLMFFDKPINNTVCEYHIEKNERVLAYGYWSYDLRKQFPDFNQLIINLT